MYFPEFLGVMKDCKYDKQEFSAERHCWSIPSIMLSGSIFHASSRLIEDDRCEEAPIGYFGSLTEKIYLYSSRVGKLFPWKYNEKLRYHYLFMQLYYLLIILLYYGMPNCITYY